ncbi:MAG: hypothetical protein ACRDO8_00915 [Nocardioidaceae bacterium]
MNEFWWATIVFVLLGLTPVVAATLLNRRQRRSGTHRQEGAR